MDKKLIKAYLPWGLCAGIFTIAAASGLFYEMDNRLSDALYQERRGTDAESPLWVLTRDPLKSWGLLAPGTGGYWHRRFPI